MRNAESIKARIKNLSDSTGRTNQDVLIAYALERTIYRISVSKYSDYFTLKGGIFLYALFHGEFSRVTTDIDLLAQHINNDSENMKNIFKEIFSIESNDPLFFDINTLTVSNITEFKKYHGVNVSIIALLDKTRIPVSIDIGFGDIIYPNRTLIDFPCVLDDDSAQIYAYSLYSSVAEKFEAMVSLGYANSRFKDFYDVYILNHKYDFEGSTLQNALLETFEHRNTAFDDLVIFEDDFINDTLRQSRWKAFAKKKKISLKITLQETLGSIKTFLNPVVESIVANRQFNLSWNHETQQWDA